MVFHPYVYCLGLELVVLAGEIGWGPLDGSLIRVHGLVEVDMWVRFFNSVIRVGCCS